jgi:hypothetical protein
MTVSAKDQPDQSGAALKSSLKEARKGGEARSSLRIEVEGQLGTDISQVILYGHGIGIWNGERQFTATSKMIDSAIDLLLEAKYFNMPDRFAFEEKESKEKPVLLVRIVTVSVGGHSKTVVRGNKGPNSQAFKTLTTELVALCKTPAEEGTTADNLEDGLRKVADGTLAPETFRISVNAPQLRSLESQTGQGWLLTVQHGTLSVRSNILGEGIRDVGKRSLTAREVQALAKKLLDAGVAEWPQNINTTGHTQFTVAVLNHREQTMARQFARTPDEADKAVEKAFAAVRGNLYALYEKEASK